MSTRKRSTFSLRRNTVTSNSTNIGEGLKSCYRKVLRPFEEYYDYHLFHSAPLEDADFDAKPTVMLIGQYSTGKTTFIRYLLGEDFPGIRIGPEPTTDKFNIIMKDSEKRIIPGNALVMDQTMQYRHLAQFGNAFLNRLQCSLSDAAVLNGITLVDTPGILSGQKQSVDRGYDFTQVFQWFASRVDRILLLFDAHKLDISDELRRAILAIKGHDDKIRIVLNKSDLIDPQELMRVYGALMWSLGKVLDTPEVVRVYLGSFWDQPLQHVGNRELFEREEHDLLSDLKSLPRHAALRKLNDFIKRARAVKIHGLIITELVKNMPSFIGKDRKKKELISNLESIYSDLQERHKLSPGDFPPISYMKEKLETLDWSNFKIANKQMMDKIDKMLSEEMPKIMSNYSPMSEMEEPSLNGPIETVVSSSTPFQTVNTAAIDSNLKWSRSSSQNENSSEWYVSNEPKYDEWSKRFEELEPIDGKLNGAVVKKEFLKSRLPKAALSKIWTLSDRNQDGLLDKNEFILAQYLIECKLKGKDLPHILPSHLIPINDQN